MVNNKKQQAPKLVADLTPEELALHRRQIEKDKRPMVRLSPEELARNRQRIAEEIQPFARKQKAPRLVADLTPEGLADALTEAALQRQNWVAAYDELPALDPARVAEILVAIDHSSPVSEILASSKDPRDQMVLCLQAELASAIEKIVEQRRQMQRGIR